MKVELDKDQRNAAIDFKVLANTIARIIQIGEEPSASIMADADIAWRKMRQLIPNGTIDFGKYTVKERLVF